MQTAYASIIAGRFFVRSHAPDGTPVAWAVWRTRPCRPGVHLLPSRKLPHQMPPKIEARVIALRRTGGPATSTAISLAEGLAPVRPGGKSGFVDKTGKVIWQGPGTVSLPAGIVVVADVIDLAQDAAMRTFGLLGLVALPQPLASSGPAG